MMDFDELLATILQLLQQEKRLSYRALKRRFALDDEYLEDLTVLPTSVRETRFSMAYSHPYMNPMTWRPS
jgi:hypothetical protein